MVNKKKYISSMQRWFEEQRLRISEEKTHLKYMAALVENFKERQRLARRNLACLLRELAQSEKDFAKYLRINGED